MRRALPLLTTAALLAALTACTPAPEPAPAPTSPSASPARTTSTPTTAPSPTASASPTRSVATGATPSASMSSSEDTPSTRSPSATVASSSTAPTTVAPTATGPSLAPLHRDPDSLQVLVNKHHPVPANWTAPDLVSAGVVGNREGMLLRKPAAEALQGMAAAARADGIELILVSAHRTHDYQAGLYSNSIQRNGQAHANRYSARPGHSEHHTGLAADLAAADGTCTLQGCFADTPEGAWIAQHAVEHGFVVRYPQGSEPITGYGAEPWHLRFLGVDEARRVMEAGGIVETAWGADPAPDYLP
ncbi:M15 family metallopeptidase [Micrococcus terreus]|uniref:M15 family metallopeptidase n=1 Tax=Micrococcus terreus TaxID=574650 RepID=UPI00340822AB